MKQNIGYFFKNKTYYDYDTLVKDFAANWKEAIQELKDGRLQSYLETVDPYIHGIMQAEFKRCKYLDNILSLILLQMAPNLGYCIKGKFFKGIFDIIAFARKEYSRVIVAVQNFIEDKCLSRLFINDIISYEGGITAFVEELPLIEANIKNSFVYYYFIKHFEPQEIQEELINPLNYYLSPLIGETKILEKLYKVTRRDDFLYELTKYIGFKETLAYQKNDNFVFGLYDLIKSYLSFDFTSLVYEGYHIFMLANFKNYSYAKGKPRDIFGQYVKLSSRYAKGKNLDLDFARQCFELYYRFVEYHKNDTIVPLAEAYFLDKVSCNTFACSAYDDEAEDAKLTTKEILKHSNLENNEDKEKKIKKEKKDKKQKPVVVKEESKEPVPSAVDTDTLDFTKVNAYVPTNGDMDADFSGNLDELPPISEEPTFIFEETFDIIEEPVVDPLDDEGYPHTDAALKMKNHKTSYGKKTRFAFVGLALSIWFVIEIIFALIQERDIVEKTFDRGMLVCTGILLLVSMGLIFTNARSKALAKKYYDENGNPTKECSAFPKLERRKIRKKIYYSFRAWTTLFIVLASYCLICMLVYYFMPLLDKVTGIEWAVKAIDAWNNYYILIAPVLALIICIVKKRKNILFTILTFVIEIVVIAAAVIIASLF